MEPFYKTVLRTSSEFLHQVYLIRETFLRYKTNILFLAFNDAKESVFFFEKMWLVRLLNKTVSKKEKRELSAK